MKIISISLFFSISSCFCYNFCFIENRNYSLIENNHQQQQLLSGSFVESNVCHENSNHHFFQSGFIARGYESSKITIITEKPKSFQIHATSTEVNGTSWFPRHLNLFSDNACKSKIQSFPLFYKPYFNTFIMNDEKMLTIWFENGCFDGLSG